MNNSRFSNGFMLGLIVGGGAVFLLGTKTGKKILKNLSEQGWEGLTEMLEEVDLGEDEEEESMEEVSSSNHQHADEEVKEEVKEEPKESTKKRFFRKSSKQ
ncbi:MAG: hypothetical protein M1444_03635 [Patescibacteria group bacterium]|nr:hypothetical protein [Patescibacteria group bacterium]